MSAAPELVPEMLTSCSICNEYLDRRMTAVCREIILVQGKRETAFAELVRYAQAVHDRHLAGLSLGAVQ